MKKLFSFCLLLLRSSLLFGMDNHLNEALKNLDEVWKSMGGNLDTVDLGSYNKSVSIDRVSDYIFEQFPEFNLGSRGAELEYDDDNNFYILDSSKKVIRVIKFVGWATDCAVKTRGHDCFKSGCAIHMSYKDLEIKN